MSLFVLGIDVGILWEKLRLELKLLTRTPLFRVEKVNL